MDKYYTPEEVAEKYDVKVTTVRDWIRRGQLAAIDTGRMYRITPADLEKFEAERRTKVEEGGEE